MVSHVGSLGDHLVDETCSVILERHIEVEDRHLFEPIHEVAALFMEIPPIGSVIGSFDVSLMTMFSGIGCVLSDRPYHAYTPDCLNEALKLRNLEVGNNAIFPSPTT